MASYIERRKFLATLGGAAAAWPFVARAQQLDRMALGVLTAFARTMTNPPRYAAPVRLPLMAWRAIPA
jgi:hypothetical protein